MTKVRYKYGETFQNQQPEFFAGIYEIHNMDDYIMCGFIEIKDINGNIFVVDGSLLEVLND